MELGKQSSKFLFFICLVASASGQIIMSNPSNLANVTEITPGMPFAINCNADAVGTYEVENITRLQIHRRLRGETQGSLIADFNLNDFTFANREIINIPPERNWITSFPTEISASSSRQMNLQLQINDPQPSDAGIYQCTITCTSEESEAITVGQQKLTAKAAVANNLFISPTLRFSDRDRLSKMYNIALTCGADGGPNLEMFWLSVVQGSEDVLSYPNPEDIVDEYPSPIAKDESNLMRYRSTLTVQLAQGDEDVKFLCVVGDTQAMIVRRITISISPAGGICFT